MKIRRVVTGEREDGTAFVRDDGTIIDTDRAEPATVLWGFDRVPQLPIRPEDVGPEHVERGLFPGGGGASVNLIVFPPAGEYVPTAEEIDMGDAGLLTPEKDAGGMHRTDSVDLMLVIEGEVRLRHAGDVDDVVLGAGDFVVQNGTMHEWENRSPNRCVMACFVVSAPRAG